MLEIQSKAVEELNLLKDSFVVENGGINYPDWYGGAYINHEHKAVVMVTYLDRGNMARIQEITENSDILFKEVKNPYNELLKTNDALLNLLDEHDLMRFTASIAVSEYYNNVAIDLVANEYSLNSVNLEQDDITMDNLEEYLTYKLQRALFTEERSVEPEIIEIGFAAERAELTSLRAGQRVGLSALNAPGDASFGYRSRLRGMTGYLSAGHAFINTPNGAQVFANGQPVGWLRDKGFADNTNADWAFIEIMPGVTMTSEINGSSTLISTSSHQHWIHAGQNIRKSGDASGDTQGVVTSKTSISIAFRNPATMVYTTITDLFESEAGTGWIQGGDSGGVVYSMHIGMGLSMGIITGSLRQVPVTGNTFMYTTKASNLVSRGVTLF
jgi:hypothetical protein